MNFFYTFLFIILSFNTVLSQSHKIQDIFSQNVFREDFNLDNKIFPIEQNENQFAVFLKNEGQYFIGSEEANYNLILNWENDLKDYEFKTAVTLSPEEKINLFQTENPQKFGILFQYNPDNQEGLIFEINSVKKYRLIHIKNGRSKKLTFSSSNEDGWIKSNYLRKNEKNEILIKSKDNRFEYFINGQFEFAINLDKKNIDPLSPGRFGFNLGKYTKVKIDYLYIYTTASYNGINQQSRLSNEDSKKLIKENEELKQKLILSETKKNTELKNVIQLLESELKNANIINDSLQIENSKFEPFKSMMDGNADFLYTLSKNLKDEIQKNRVLKNEKKVLLDSIQKLIDNQEIFKLEYLNTLITIEQQDTID
tara:strand:+ start:267 stop:1370 length:1104 start_codon:yes stop_codon:yes gene_type:complete